VTPSRIKIKKGININMLGEPLQNIYQGNTVKKVALVASDYVGLKPKLLVEIGQEVTLGEPLFIDKRDPKVQYVSPGEGRIVAINRARRRQLKSIVIELNSKPIPDIVFKTIPINKSNNKIPLRDTLLKSGLWSSFRTRPYDRVADSSSSPRSIFVTAIDTRPLAANPNITIAHRKSEFIKGMAIIRQLGDWPLYLCVGSDWSGPKLEDGIKTIQFDGPHPAGLAGTHIHHLDPVGINHSVWYIGYQDVIDMGYLFQTGRLLTERIVSIAGSAVVKPRLIKTRIGANIKELVSNETSGNIDCRFLSGSVLDGTDSDQSSGYLGRYHNQISIIPNAKKHKKFSWLRPFMWLYSRNGWFSLRRSKRNHNTASHGRSSAMIPVEAFERIMPLEILVAPLLRAILVKDTEVAQNLGCLELAEEDLALCSYVCPAKQDYGTVLRKNLDQIEQEG
jgi:Na+-transporting NADH:ubiquinone oxidoreductase subunit A